VNRARKPSRLVLRRRLVLFSAPVTLVALLAAAKMISVVVAGNAAVTNYRDGDTEALSGNTSVLNVLNVIEPAKAPFASGALAVAQGRLDEAEARFSEALALTDAGQSCPVLVNLELVRERRGDVDGWDGRREQARERYRSALDIVRTAPPGCFENNTDADPERRAVRADAAARLAAKLAGLDTAPPPPPPPPPPAAPPPAAPPPVVGASSPEGQRGDLRLDPGAGDPNDKLRQILQDAAG
jgi:tetratricopeptide (TPR) repeat protein